MSGGHGDLLISPIKGEGLLVWEAGAEIHVRTKLSTCLRSRGGERGAILQPISRLSGGADVTAGLPAAERATHRAKADDHHRPAGGFRDGVAGFYRGVRSGDIGVCRAAADTKCRNSIGPGRARLSADRSWRRAMYNIDRYRNRNLPIPRKLPTIPYFPESQCSGKSYPRWSQGKRIAAKHPR